MHSISLRGENKYFVIEACQNCGEHHWNTRHDEKKYSNMFQKLANMIVKAIPNSMVMKNQIPKMYFNYEIYNNLIEDDSPD